MTNTTLSINFFNGNISDDNKTAFMSAINYEYADMSIKASEDTISRLEKQASRNDITKQEKDAIMVKIEAEKESITKFQSTKNTLEKTYNDVVKNMSQFKDGSGNNKDTVRTVLRVLATWNNSKLIKYAIIPAFTSIELYDALETIHINSTAGENGNIIMSKAVKEAYKKASDTLEHIIKVTFSLPCETPYTTKTRVKLTADDKKLLNDCYIKGFRNKFETSDDGIVTFKKRTINTLVKTKKDKKTGETIYDYSGLASTIANIVIKHYFA